MVKFSGLGFKLNEDEKVFEKENQIFLNLTPAELLQKNIIKNFELPDALQNIRIYKEDLRDGIDVCDTLRKYTNLVWREDEIPDFIIELGVVRATAQGYLPIIRYEYFKTKCMAMASYLKVHSQHFNKKRKITETDTSVSYNVIQKLRSEVKEQLDKSKAKKLKKLRDIALEKKKKFLEVMELEEQLDAYLTEANIKRKEKKRANKYKFDFVIPDFLEYEKKEENPMDRKFESIPEDIRIPHREQPSNQPNPPKCQTFFSANRRPSNQ